MYYTVLSVTLQYYRRKLQKTVLEKSKLSEFAYEMVWN